ncbi:MAG: NUDIX hydrolase [Alphaproteobacteria bacterium]|nr:NUDIX hydrolase [Alphaproteobacteria bacterium]MBT4085527.1 NUDIX hydrolase [Alphaproteobacteria bacterium]MBT4544296.1 NUDIX hydrolase [Alphaproteobacteria bacterium]
MVEISEEFRITTKAVICLDGKVVLLRKSTGKWDLPGGRLGDGEEIEFGLTREAEEELGLEIVVGPLIQCSLRRVADSKSNVIVVAYLCTLSGAFSDIVLSTEHTDVRLFSRHEIDNLDMRESYRKSVHMVFSKPLNGLDAQHTPSDTASARTVRSFFQKLKSRWVSSWRRST